MYINMTGGKTVTAINTLIANETQLIGEFATEPTDKTFYELTLIANSTIDEYITIREIGLVENVAGVVNFRVDRIVESRSATILDAGLHTVVEGDSIKFYVKSNNYSNKLNWFLSVDKYNTKALV